MDSLDRPEVHPANIKKVAILFAGGPAPAANAVISTAASSFLRSNVEVVGILNGYSHLVHYSPERPLQPGQDYIPLDGRALKRTRNTRGVLLGTARANPGKDVTHPAHLDDPARTARLRTVYDALRSLGVDALVSIGGDDTLTTANKFKLFQDRLSAGEPRIRVVHVPKTIDNDYRGIDFTFGFFTAVDTLANSVRNLLADAEAGRSYYMCETMGRRAGWLAYGVAIAGEASLVISVEDVAGKFLEHEEFFDEHAGRSVRRAIMNVDEMCKRIVATMLARERDGKEFGVVVLAEGLAEYLPSSYLQGVERDDHGHIAIAKLNLSRLFATKVARQYTEQTGRERKVVGLQLGYEARCASPNAFDVMLGSQLGVGAYLALAERQLNGVMVSASGQLELSFVPFTELVDPEKLLTVVRYVEPNSDFHRLARFLETEVNR